MEYCEKQQEKWECRDNRDNKESYMPDMKRRINLQSIGAYIRDEGVKTVISNDGFRQRKNEAYSKLVRFFTEKYGKKEMFTIEPRPNEYASVVEEIYFNLGMKAGATLQCKLTDNFETDI